MTFIFEWTLDFGVVRFFYTQNRLQNLFKHWSLSARFHGLNTSSRQKWRFFHPEKVREKNRTPWTPWAKALCPIFPSFRVYGGWWSKCGFLHVKKRGYFWDFFWDCFFPSASRLGGGFKDFLFSPQFGEDFQFDYSNIFWDGVPLKAPARKPSSISLANVADSRL